MLHDEIIRAWRKHFPYIWESLYALSVVRLLDPVPLKSVKFFSKMEQRKQAFSHILPELGE